jgi:hypothetical protein
MERRSDSSSLSRGTGSGLLVVQDCWWRVPAIAKSRWRVSNLDGELVGQGQDSGVTCCEGAGLLLRDGDVPVTALGAVSSACFWGVAIQGVDIVG